MSKYRILVVDDEQSMRDFLSIFLAKNGWDAVQARDGREAIRMLEGGPFDLVI